jgi:DHA1 family bicyclomycin/chloramphenicol resistance-like MFS transporter
MIGALLVSSAIAGFAFKAAPRAHVRANQEPVA